MTVNKYKISEGWDGGYIYKENDAPWYEGASWFKVEDVIEAARESNTWEEFIKRLGIEEHINGHERRSKT